MEDLDNYLKAAQIAASVRAVAEDSVKPGARLLDAAVEIEEEIKSNGGGFAFPVNISLNEVAAHYTPREGEETVFTEKHVAKVDFGVHVEGCIIDQAFTVDLTDENGKLVEASAQALEDALAVMRAGASVRNIGAAIQSAIESRGFKPVENLSGHSLEPYLLHAGNEVPNTARGNYILKEGDYFAVEPFATNGAGKVTERGVDAEIYSLVNPKPVRLPQSRALLDFVSESFRT
ncbi:MAG: type II methionyl aminopeptidase, partial [Candidatus Micrarchaeia archaeon]